MPSQIEILESMNGPRFEEAYRRAITNCDAHNEGFAERGMRLARAKDPLFLKVLEKWAEHMDKLADEQHGRTRRSMGADYALRTLPTEAAMVTEAYRLADAGTPVANLKWIYGGAAWLAGYT